MEIRLATPADAAGVAAIYAPVVTSSHISFELEPPTTEEMAGRMADVMPRHPWVVVVDGGEVAGYAYAHRFSGRAAYDWSVETSIYVAPANRGAGVGRALYGSLLDLLGRQGFRQAIAGIALPNPASERVHASAGFRPYGVQRRIGYKLGTWIDVLWLQRDLAAGDDPPTPPLSVDRLPADVLQAALRAGWGGG